MHSFKKNKMYMSAQIFPDPGFRREMKQLLVYCVHEGCVEQLRFSNLERHVKECVHREVQCINSPRGCRELIKFKDVELHLKECGYRPIICEQCGSEFSFNSKQEHDLEQCPEALVSCTYLCGQEMKRRLLEDHKAVCPKKPAECQFKILGCTFTGSSEEVRKHEQDVGSHFQVLLECFTTFRLQSLEMQKNLEETKRNQERIDNIVKNIHRELKLKMVQQVERLIIAEQKVEEHVQQLATVTEEAQHTRQSIEQLKALIPQVASHDRQVASHEIRMAEMDLRFQMIETASYDGKLLWKIRDFSHRKR
ncbi:unnamed protein product, partial [Candidula unifasciata]